MKFAFIFGKGIDGCGVTRGTQIFEEWLIKNGHTTSVFSFETRQVLTRGKRSSFLGDVTTVAHEELEISDEVVKAVNKCDVAIFHNYPTRKCADSTERLLRFIKKIETLKVMHDHGVSQNTINAIPQAGEFYSYADILVAQSTTGLSARAYTKFDPSLEGRVVENPIWIEPKGLEKYDVPFEDRRKVLNYTGRNSPVKQIALLCDTMPRLLELGWTGELMGVERSINAVSAKPAAPLQPKYRHMIQYWTQNKFSKRCMTSGGFLEVDASPVPIYCTDSYSYPEGMTALGSSMASWAGYRLKDKTEYGSRMEYTQIEACLLTVPVLNVDFAANARSGEGFLWGEYDCFLTSQLGADEQLAEDLLRISNSAEEWNARHHCAKDLVTRMFDIENLAPKFLETLAKLGKKPDGPRGIDLMNWWPEAADLRSDGEIIMTTANSILNGRKLVMNGTIQKELK